MPKTSPLTLYGPTQKAEVDTRQMTARGLLATGSRDRQGDIIDLAGIDLSRHQGNPLAMVDHAKWHPLPIGKCADEAGRYTVWRDPELDALWQITRFSQSSQVAEQIFALLEEDMIRGNSVNVRPITVSQLAPDPARGFHRNPKTGSAGRHVEQSELLEVSWCAIPVNPDAAFAAIEKSWCGRSLDAGLVQAIKPYLPARRAWGTGWAPEVDESPWSTIEKAMATAEPVGTDERPDGSVQHSYASTQFNLADCEDAPLAELEALRDAIDPADLAGKGAETELHVTLLYGLHDDDPAGVIESLAECGPVEITMGNVSLFRGDECDVVKVDVSGKSLHDLRERVARACPHTDHYPTYRPHITLAYVKSGRGIKYVAPSGLEGRTLACSALHFSDRAGNRTRIDLAPVPVYVPAVDKEQIDEIRRAWSPDQPRADDGRFGEVSGDHGGVESEATDVPDSDENRRRDLAAGNIDHVGETFRHRVEGLTTAEEIAFVSLDTLSGLRQDLETLGDDWIGPARLWLDDYTASFTALRDEESLALSRRDRAAKKAAASEGPRRRLMKRWVRRFEAQADEARSQAEELAGDLALTVEELAESMHGDEDDAGDGVDSMLKAWGWIEKAARQIGETWQGPSGRWFVRRDDGRVVPAKGGDGGAAGSKATRGDSEKATKKPRATPETREQKSASGGLDAVRGLLEKARQGEGIIKELSDAIASLSQADVNALKKELGQKAGGKKVEQAKKLAEWALTSESVIDLSELEDVSAEMEEQEAGPDNTLDLSEMGDVSTELADEATGRLAEALLRDRVMTTEAIRSELKGFSESEVAEILGNLVEANLVIPAGTGADGIQVDGHTFNSFYAHDSLGMVVRQGNVARVARASAGRVREARDRRAKADAERRQAVGRRIADAKHLLERVSRLSQLGGAATEYERAREAYLEANREASAAYDRIHEATRPKEKQDRSKKWRQLTAQVEELRSKCDALRKQVEETDIAGEVRRAILLPEADAAPIVFQAEGASQSHGEETAANIKTGVDWLTGILKTSNTPAPPIRLDPTPVKRANCGMDAIRLSVGDRPGVVIHEYCHHVEHHDPSIHKAIMAFLDYRLAGESPVSLKQRFPDADYADGETGAKDRFDRAFGEGRHAEMDGYYTGKNYGRTGSSEVLTMGVQLLYNDGPGFARRDPEFCAFILGLLDGSLRDSS